MLSLPYAKRLQLERRADASRRASLAGLALMLVGARRLGPVTPRAAEIFFPAGGKPTLPGLPHFSISHAGSLVCCALSDHTRLGIDVEPGPPAGDDERRWTLRRWTAIEATLKAAGQGLRRAGAVQVAPDFCTTKFDGTQYALQALELWSGTVCHVAATVPLRLGVDAVDLSAAEVSATLQDSFRLGA